MLRCIIIQNCFLEYSWGDLRVAHWEFLRFVLLLLRAFKLIHEALVVVDVPTSRNLFNLTLIVVRFDADSILEFQIERQFNL